VLALSKEIALPGLALLATVLLLIGCGGGSADSKNASAGSSASKSVAAAHAEHPVDMFPALVPRGKDGQATIVRVGSTAITAADFAHWDEVLTPKIASYEPKSREDCSSARAPLEVKLSARQKAAKLSPAQVKALCVSQHQELVKESALGQLISNQWVIGEAAELGLGMSDAEAQQRLAKVRAVQFKSKAEFLHYLAGTGRTPADALLGVRLAAATERIQDLIERKANSKIDDAAIARYYHEHEKSFEVPERRDIRAIRTWTHTAIAKAMGEVRAGKSIASVAERVSIDKPSNKEGGLIAGIAKGQEEAGFDQAIFAAKPHTLTGPLHLRKRYYAFEVVAATPGGMRPFKEIEASVREKLSVELLHKEQASIITAFRKKWLARTSCSAGYVVSRCREYHGPSPVVSEDPYEVT
jgi:parvulin-like peptidyl-prolyl isomerase